MTGAVTNASIRLTHEQNLTLFGKYIGLIACYTFGGVIAGYFGGNYDSFHIGHSYGILYLIMFVLMLGATFLDKFLENDDVSFIFCCATAAGVQNALVSRFSGNMIRTSHVTGSLTDIGLTIGRALKGKTDQIWKLGILIPLVLTFLFGGLMAGWIYEHLGKLSLIVSAILYGFTAILYAFYFTRISNISYFSVFFGARDVSAVSESNRSVNSSSSSVLR
jgi:uncharacterized membrane protein YoaK (UPF0700 family)